MFSDCDPFIVGYILAHHGSYFSLLCVRWAISLVYWGYEVAYCRGEKLRNFSSLDSLIYINVYRCCIFKCSVLYIP